MPTNPADLLIASIHANDADQVRQVLDAHPSLKSRLNDSAPCAPFGQTPLLAAVRRRNRDMIDVLLQAGADINARSHWWAGGFGVLDDDHGLAPFLIERGATVDAHAAARLGMLDKLAELLAANPDLIHSRGGDGQTPLHFASTVEVATFLLDRGADIDARDIDHESTPAQHMLRDRREIAKFLVSRGCRTDLLMASALGDETLVRKHLATDPASIHLTVSDAHFPMSDPRAGGHIYTWTLGKYKTPHALARESDHKRIFNLLMDHTPPALKLIIACEAGDEPLSTSLRAAHPDVIASLSHDQKSRLPMAAVNNNTPAVRLMLAAGWPVEATAQHGGTPLHWAAFHGNAEMLREILKHKPPLELKDKDFHSTPLGWAIHGSKNGWYAKTGDYAATVEALLNAGARSNSIDPASASEAVQQILRKHGITGESPLASA